MKQKIAEAMRKGKEYEEDLPADANKEVASQRIDEESEVKSGQLVQVNVDGSSVSYKAQPESAAKDNLPKSRKVSMRK